VDSGVVEDAMSPGAAAFPTALTEPAGAVSASLSFGADSGLGNSELTSISASAALTNQISISATALIPTESFRLGVLSAKGQVLRYERIRIALQGNFIFDNESDQAGLIGAAGTLCLDDACNSYASGYLGVGIIHGSGSSGVPFTVSGSVVAQVVPHLKIVGEAVTGFTTSDISGQSDGFIGFLGARLTSKFAGVNLGLARPFGLGGDESAVFFGSITGRFMTM
jgi:hypothetical protein